MLGDAVSAKKSSGEAKETLEVIDVAQLLARSVIPAVAVGSAGAGNGSVSAANGSPGAVEEGAGAADGRAGGDGGPGGSDG
jgi:hypothetical protein